MNDRKSMNPEWLNSISFNKETKCVEIVVESGRDDELYRAFGLEPGDDASLSVRLSEELAKFIEEKRNESGT